MTPDELAALRAPFPDNEIGQLPKIACKACTDSKLKYCDKHRKEKCKGCGNYITTAHTHLDYVGHAAVTQRLLAVDPGWTWEPVAFDDRGLPAIDQNGGLWIRLTVLDVTRLGYGHADGKGGGNALKEAIGDAIRNAAMRFGVAIDLWHKGTLSGATYPTHDDADDDDTPTEPAAATHSAPDEPKAAPQPARRTIVRKTPSKATDEATTGDTATESQVRMAMALMTGLKMSDDDRHAMVFGTSQGRTEHVRELTKREMSTLID
jgi:hypothetical protein